jgi:glycerol-3-phosphate dehydrogenase (NAD(P)+)
VMGAAMTLPAAERGHTLRLVGTPLDTPIIEAVAAKAPHPRLGIVLPPLTTFTHDRFAAAVGDDTELIVLGVGSAGIGYAVEALAHTLTRPIHVLMVTKGLAADGQRILTLPEVVAAGVMKRSGILLDIAAVAGPCIAMELVARRQTSVIFTSGKARFAERLAAEIETDYYHPRVEADVTGVEACAALKNFFAIAVGAAAHPPPGAAADGHGHNNPAASVFSQALAEMAVLVEHMGGRPESVAGMAGAGDLYVTCQGGRNSRLGRHLGHGLTVREVRDGPMQGETVEGAELGAALAPTLRRLMADGSLDPRRLPLTAALLGVLADGGRFTIPWPLLHRSV